MDKTIITAIAVYLVAMALVIAVFRPRKPKSHAKHVAVEITEAVCPVIEDAPKVSAVTRTTPKKRAPRKKATAKKKPAKKASATKKR